MIDVTRPGRSSPHRPGVDPEVNDDTTKKDKMFTAMKDKLSDRHRAAKQERELYRAIAHAPTEASRQELLGMHSASNR